MEIDLILLYLVQMGVCMLINMINNTAIPKTLLELIKLTFLPYLLLNLKKHKRK